MSSPPSTRAHSADVRMQLIFDGITLPLEQLGPDFVILRKPMTAMPPNIGEILLRIDGSERRWSVRLPEGIDIATQATPIHFLPQSSIP